MKVNLLCENYKSEELLYDIFLENSFEERGLVSEEYVMIPQVPDFPVYFGKVKIEEKNRGFSRMVEVLGEYFVDLDKEIYMDERFWHSFLCLKRRDYLLETYPSLRENKSAFDRIVLKKFDWENYLYKGVLIARYIKEYGKNYEKEEYYDMILKNLDLFNYIIKYEIFRNGPFLINVLEIVRENDLGSILKGKIKDRPDLGKDERYGRRVIYEFNKSYPILPAPMLPKEELKEEFLKRLALYYSGEDVEVIEDEL